MTKIKVESHAIYLYIPVSAGSRGQEDRARYLLFAIALARRSTSAHPWAPRTHTTVAAPGASGSGTAHRTSCTSGHGHSPGRGTHASVPGHWYSPHGTAPRQPRFT
jgi:hypothetical protein